MEHHNILCVELSNLYFANLMDEQTFAEQDRRIEVWQRGGHDRVCIEVEESSESGIELEESSECDGVLIVSDDSAEGGDVCTEIDYISE